MSGGDDSVKKVFTEEAELEPCRINKICFPRRRKGLKTFLSEAGAQRVKTEGGRGELGTGGERQVASSGEQREGEAGKAA